MKRKICKNIFIYFFFHQTLNSEHVSKFLKRDKKEGKIISEKRKKKTLKFLVSSLVFSRSPKRLIISDENRVFAKPINLGLIKD